MDKREIVMFNRHDMLQISKSCREYALKESLHINPLLEKSLLSKALATYNPAIVKMQDNDIKGFIDVGFSSHLIKDGVRVRVKSVIPTCGIQRVISPFEVAEHIGCCKHNHIRQGIECIIRIASECGLDVGLFGSCALELITGKPYITEKSDIDVIIKRNNPDTDIEKFYKTSAEISRNTGVSFDIEVMCIDRVGVKLAELFSEQKTILCKGLYGLEIRLKKDICI